MLPTPQEPDSAMQDRFFLRLLLVVSLLFAWVLWPFFGALVWAVVFTILFMRVNRRLTAAFGGRRTLGALTTTFGVVVLVIMPLMFVGSLLAQQAAGVYEQMKSREIDVEYFARRIFEALPSWATSLLDQYGLTDFAALQDRLSTGLAAGSKVVAAHLLGFGQSTLEFVVSFFVMLYVLFFLLRDGDGVMQRVRAAIPLSAQRRDALLDRFGVVVRASVKGNVVVALVQGALGGLIFWILGIQAALLWAVVMAILSLLPAVGTALVWGPVALYFLATGATVKGIVLIAYGVLVIGLVDNVLRPLLVGKDTRIPDYVILLATLGGIAAFGVNGFIIGPVIAALFLSAWELFIASRQAAREAAPPPDADSATSIAPER